MQRWSRVWGQIVLRVQYVQLKCCALLKHSHLETIRLNFSNAQRTAFSLRVGERGYNSSVSLLLLFFTSSPLVAEKVHFGRTEREIEKVEVLLLVLQRLSLRVDWDTELPLPPQPVSEGLDGGGGGGGHRAINVQRLERGWASAATFPEPPAPTTQQAMGGGDEASHSHDLRGPRLMCGGNLQQSRVGEQFACTMRAAVWAIAVVHNLILLAVPAGNIGQCQAITMPLFPKRQPG
eukprot:SAG11_NODE_58_length_19205_cov_30.697315_19_plen_235_part_00